MELFLKILAVIGSLVATAAFTFFLLLVFNDWQISKIFDEPIVTYLAGTFSVFICGIPVVYELFEAIDWM